MGSIGFNSNSQLQVNGTPFQTGFKNYIINGNFDVWQYGTSQTTSGFGSDDRWSNQNVGSTKTHSQVACSDTERALFNATYFSRTVVTSVVGASNFVIKRQTIENVTRLAGKTITISFWAKADGNKNIAIELQQGFGSGGSPSASVDALGVQLIALTSTWQKKTITVAMPSIVGKTLGTDGIHTSATTIRFWFDAGSNFNATSASLGQQSGTFDIAQVQIEEGAVATPFENRPYGLELSLCQRYYEVGACSFNGHKYAWTPASNNTRWLIPIEFSQSKRVVPTMAIYDNLLAVGKITTLDVSGNVVQNGQTCESYGFINSAKIGLSNMATAPSAHAGLAFTWTASAEL